MKPLEEIQTANLVVQLLEIRLNYTEAGVELSEQIVRCFFAHFSDIKYLAEKYVCLTSNLVINN